MGLIIQQRALQAAGGLRQVLPLAVAYGYVTSSRVTNLDIALDEICAMSWRLSGR